MSSSQFRVIIVGGGIAGLSLANMLERFRIDYVLLESGGEIAPPAGSSIGVTPNGLLILDQLGCYEPMREVSRCAEVNNAHHRDETGRSRACAEDLFAHIEKR